MKNLPILAGLSFGVAILVIIAAIWTDAFCLSSGTGACRVWRSVQWESIVAGALGLMGGLFVIYGTQRQIQAQREDMVSARMQDVMGLYERIKENIADIQTFIEARTDEQKNDLEVDLKDVKSHWNNLRSSLDHETLHHRVQSDPSYPPKLKRACTEARNSLINISQILMSEEASVWRTTTRIAYILNELSPNLIDAFKTEIDSYRKQLTRT